jgi:glucuronoarabinoxylan endo-1,4-beta-xylanase
MSPLCYRGFGRRWGLATTALACALAGVSGGCVTTGGGARGGPDAGGGNGGGGGGGGSGGAQAADVTVTVDVTDRHQTMVGFGASMAYYADFVSRRNVQGDDLDQVLFSDLGLDILRLGNWYQNQIESGSSPATPFTDAAAPIIVQRATAALGHRPLVLMSSWTPPAYLKSNGDTKNGGTLDQMASAYDYTGFAAWWASTIAAYGGMGFVPDYISIQNEPELKTPYESCLLDATEGTNAGYPEALAAVHGALAASTLTPPPQLVGPETVGPGGLAPYLPSIDTSQLGAIAHHLYGAGAGGNDPAPDSFLDAMTATASLASASGKPLFMTEFAPAQPSLLNTAWLIHNAVAVEGVSAYLYWALVWAPGTPVNWLVTVEDPTTTFRTPKGYTINDPYYALKHFARWVDEGWVRVGATSPAPAVKASAFVSSDGNSLTVVLINTDGAEHTVAIAPGGFAATTTAAYRSSGASERTATVALGTGNVVDLPAQAIATVTLAH